MYDSLIFDIDGTLIDTHEATIMALKKVLKEETGRNFAFEELEFVIGIPGEVSLPRLGVKDVNTANEKWNAYLKYYSDHIKVYPGIIDMLVRLKDAGVKTGFVTSNTRYELEGLLSYFMPFRLTDFAHKVVCADDTKRHKPYPDPILRYLELSGDHTSKTIYIGDTVYDMKCAKAANVDFGLALWGAKSMEGIESERVFGNPYEILEILNRSMDAQSNSKALSP